MCSNALKSSANWVKKPARSKNLRQPKGHCRALVPSLVSKTKSSRSCRTSRGVPCFHKLYAPGAPWPAEMAGGVRLFSSSRGSRALGFEPTACGKSRFCLCPWVPCLAFLKSILTPVTFSIISHALSGCLKRISCQITHCPCMPGTHILPRAPKTVVLLQHPLYFGPFLRLTLFSFAPPLAEAKTIS